MTVDLSFFKSVVKCSYILSFLKQKIYYSVCILKDNRKNVRVRDEKERWEVLFVLYGMVMVFENLYQLWLFVKDLYKMEFVQSLLCFEEGVLRFYFFYIVRSC